MKKTGIAVFLLILSVLLGACGSSEGERNSALSNTLKSDLTESTGRESSFASSAQSKESGSYAQASSETEDARRSSAAISESLMPSDVPSTSSESESVPSLPTSDPQPSEKSEEQIFLDTMKKRNYALTGEALPYFVGRWYDKNGNKITCTDGSSFYFMVNGADSFDVIFEEITTGETPYFAYAIDEGTPKRQQINKPTVTLPDSGKHLVQIIADGMCEWESKWTKDTGFCFKEVSLPEGGTVQGVKPLGKVIFFYGDSITEGVNALAPNSTSSHNSAINSYAYICADKLGAVNYHIGYGASGIVTTGSFNTMLKAIDYLNSSRKTDDSVIPDLIVINHGTNDGGAGDSQFEGELRKTLKRLTEKYSGVPVVYMIPFNQAKAESIRRICGEFENVSVVETEGWKIAYTDGLHPSRSGAKTAGNNLYKALLELFGKDFFEAGK